jgi:TRAP-type transport system small permease protein
MSQDTLPVTAPPAPDDRADRVLGRLSAIPLALIVLLTFADVFARYLFARPIRGSVEIIQYAMALVIFTALPLVTRHRGHVTVSLIDKLVTGRTAWVKQVVCDALSTMALALITWRLAAQAASDTAGSTQTVVLGLPQAPLAYTLCLFAAIATLVMAGLLLRTLRGELPATGGQA